MILLVSVPVIKAGVIISETPSLVNINMELIRSVSEIRDVEKEHELYGKTVITYVNGTNQELNIPFIDFISELSKTTGFVVMDLNKIKSISPELNKQFSNIK